MKVTIDVTEEDIASGVPEHGQSCPVALAATRALGYPVHVDENGIDPVRWTPTSWSHFSPLPDPVIEKIFHYDATHFMEPFSFEVEVLED